MYQKDEDILTDIVFGEAILALLRGDAPVSNASLIQQLQHMAAVEKIPARQRACQLAIAEVKNNRPAPPKPVTHRVRGRDNIHLFTSEGPPDGAKKH
ncbi:hypothetical protein AAH446_00235 [Erwinia sp. P6884]|uniref:hypothetical protein n=1 Tax=Erwinia sp. P6884 TaxID=3141450 RepID=UPI0031859E86